MVDFSLREITEYLMWGPTVEIIWTVYPKDVNDPDEAPVLVKETMPVAFAVESLRSDPRLGTEFYKGRINFMGVYDEWSQSHCV